MRKNNNVNQILEKELDKKRDDKFMQQLTDEYFPTEKKKYYKTGKFKALMATAACLVLIAIVVPCVLLINPQQPDDPVMPEPPRFGSDFGVITEVSDIEAVNADLSGYDLNPEIVTYVTLTLDEATGDKSYYSVDSEYGFQGCRIYIVVNKYVDCESMEQERDKEFTVNGLTVQYASSMEYYPEEGIYIHLCYGKAVVGDIRIYFQPYDGWTESEDDGFDDFVQMLFIKE